MHFATQTLIAATGLSGLAMAFTNTEVKFFMRKNIDPIVVPGQYASHMHSFFGSDSVNVNMSSSADLREGCSTATNPNDLSAYWIPTLYHVEGDTRTPIEPVSFFAYYGFDQNTPDIPIPENLSLLAGNTEAKSADDLIPGSDVTWLCQKQAFDAGGKRHSQFPQSTCSTSLQAVLFFPDCVDPNDNSNVAYSKPNGRQCPDGMSSMPQLRFSIRYDTRKAIPNGWSGEPPIELACGGSECFHGDFINGWLPEAGENMLGAIFNTRTWQPVDGPNGKAKAGSICNRSARDVDPDNGTSDYEESLLMMEGASPAPAPAPVDEEETTPEPSPEPVQEEATEGTEETVPTPPSSPAPVQSEAPAETPETQPAPAPAPEQPSTCAAKRKARRAAKALRRRQPQKAM